MKVSIVVPSYNGSARLGPTLDHILASDVTTLGKTEIIVVDDGSRIPIEPIVKERNGAPNFTLRCIRQTNAGPAAARNAGFRSSHGEIVLFIDDDILIPPGLIQQHVEAHRSRPQSVVFGRCVLAKLDSSGPLFRYLNSRGFDPGYDSPDEYGEAPLIASGQISFERKMFEGDRGIYRTDLITPAAEEYELTFRLRQRLIPVFCANRIIAVHHQRVSLDSICDQAFKHATGCAEVAVKYPATLGLDGLRKLIEANRPSRRDDPAALIFKKTIKRALSPAMLRAALRHLVKLLEKASPHSTLLGPLYKSVIGLHGFAGLRTGLRTFENR